MSPNEVLAEMPYILMFLGYSRTIAALSSASASLFESGKSGDGDRFKGSSAAAKIGQFGQLVRNWAEVIASLAQERLVENVLTIGSREW
jgi:hypothetical protein